MAEKDYILSYHDSLIRQEDYELLEESKWLNDVLIEFCFEYFHNDLYKKDAEDFAYLGPSVTQLIKMGDKDLANSILDSMSIPDKKVVLIALNDETSITRSGGTHWSLIVYYPQTQTIEHYDSTQGEGNQSSASNFSNKLKAAGLPIQTRPIHAACIHQNDSYNCGIHLLANAEAILKKVLHNNQASIPEIAHSAAIKGMRHRIKNFINTCITNLGQ